MKEQSKRRAPPITVLCVDDRREMVKVMRTLIDMEHDMVSVASAHDAAEFLAATSATRPRVAVVDLTMPGQIAPMEAIRRVAAEFPETRVIAYSGYDDAETRDEALEAGARGFVSKTADPQDVIDAIRRVAAGEIAV